MKSLASVTFSFLLLASVSLFPVYAQDTVTAQKEAPAPEGKPQAAPEPAAAKDEGKPADSDASIEDILAGVEEEEKNGSEVKAEGDSKPADAKAAESKPQEVKKDDSADAKKDLKPEENVKVAEPSGEALQTEKQAVEEEKQAQEQKKKEEEIVAQEKKEDSPVKKEADQKADAKEDKPLDAAADGEKSEETADGEELKLFENPENMELGEKMPVETKELELPEDAAADKSVESSGGCIRSAGEPEEVTVPEVCDYVDIHSRRIAYRTQARKLRESLEKRRVSFEKPHFEALEKHRADIARVDAEDSASYQKAMGQKETDVKEKKPEGNLGSVADSADVPEGYSDIDELSPEELDKKFASNPKRKFFNPKEAFKDAKKKAKKDKSEDHKEEAKSPVDGDTSVKKEDSAEPKVALKEKEMPAERDESGNAVKNKKVVVPEDAPEFDPSLIQ